MINFTPQEKYIASDCSFDNWKLEELVELANTKMPFGKYSGRYLVELPENYVLWFKGKGYPPGKLGDQLRTIEEIITNGLEFLLIPLIIKK